MPQSTSLFTDVESKVVGTSAVVIYSPAGKKRNRFPEGVVEVYPSETEALAHADPAKSRHAALASGPSRSSEGFKLFYLVRWLED
ncbi:MAG TPA: hypothetical protein PLE48_10155 [Thiobacillus sp.]|nr:MAG: hypothetical protein B7Z35_14175 [Hydrogenophilales bacterium 12-61-10]OYX32291.1 MAG: hypothetical protein B7Z03_02290 [Hydrogenophilales bacterium 32-62-9]OYY62210.1 MAG: hypothetical protein B7Y50_01855 [Hydrogenophilales bacterium 28-61-11]OYZ55957.1 MAG: hypothetical protein B7Y21_13275 [Hydrogenophilales bacterium 16-61-112]OZA44396.1 MAG: hypothetical protein B7X81_10075 [Hydrogenophilales bacterium 17-61-76]HQT31386.1 hypothetical protein [Thiobacillus sp.]